MKTLLAGTVLILALVVDTSGQTHKGRWLMGAQVSELSYQSTPVNRYTALTTKLAPSVGYFIRNNLLVGLAIPLTLSNTRYATLAERQTGIGAAPFVQYYVGPFSLKPYLGVAYSYSYEQRRYKLPATPTDLFREGYSQTLTPTLGLAYFLNERVALHTGLTYNFRTLTVNRDRTVNGSSVITPQLILVDSESKTQFLSVGFGVQVFLRR